MDAFCGFARGIRGKSEELGVFSVEIRAFSGQFFNHLFKLLGENCFRPAPSAEPRSEYIRVFQNSRATFIRDNSVFLSGQKQPREAPGR